MVIVARGNDLKSKESPSVITNCQLFPSVPSKNRQAFHIDPPCATALVPSPLATCRQSGNIVLCSARCTVGLMASEQCGTAFFVTSQLIARHCHQLHDGLFLLTIGMINLNAKYQRTYLHYIINTLHWICTVMHIHSCILYRHNYVHINMICK